MARTIMVSNAVYEELKARKGSRSFSEMIWDSLGGNKAKTGEGLRDLVGILKGDTEYAEVMKYLNKRWKEWNRLHQEGSA